MTNTRMLSAWVPYQDGVPLDTSARLAVDYVLEAAAAEQVQPLLITGQKYEQTVGPEPIVNLATAYPSTTPRSAHRKRVRARGGPVLAFWPDFRMLELAVSEAGESPVVVIEQVPGFVRGWAVDIAAVDLLTSKPTPDGRSDELRTFLADLHWAGNNGWFDPRAKRDVPQMLRAVQPANRNRDLVLGAMAARGHSVASLQHLTTLIDKHWGAVSRRR